MDIFETYLGNIYRMGVTEQLTDSQYVSIMSNIQYVTTDFIDYASSILVEAFKRPIPELEQFAEKIRSLGDAFLKKYCTIRANFIMKEKIRWGYQHQDNKSNI
jgi:hypothetical protein